ncbi:MAG: magnesium/cobalt transporter CorA [Candidatus Sericytochromatia bacterium]|nr:magnesium/cobalt transporter CorA [Candidatus Sericytochromatia bacterium]
MIRHICSIDTNAGTECVQIGVADLTPTLADPGRLVWLDIEDPTPEDMAFLARQFHFHPLALEDCTHLHQRPKVDSYDTYFFMVLYSCNYEPNNGGLKTDEIDVFWGLNYVVTVHRGTVPDLIQTEARWRASGNYVKQGASFLSYLIVDSVVDNYFPVIEAINDQIEEIEEKIFLAFDPMAIQRIFGLKKELIHLRKVVVPLRDVFVMLIRREVGLVAAPTLPYLQDVYDHLIRVSDSIDTYRDLIASTIDAYLSTVANRTNEVMRRLTILTTMLMTPAVVSGIYGMNFEFMPELHWVHGYPMSLVLMLALILIEVIAFRRFGYL